MKGKQGKKGRREECTDHEGETNKEPFNCYFWGFDGPSPLWD